MNFGLGLEKAGTNPETMRRALELGVRFFDTAPCYSDGKNEMLFYEALKSSGVPREEVVISAKTHLRNPEEAMILLDRSLKNLRTSYVDIWSLHDLATPYDEQVFPALDKAKKSGKAKNVGVTCNRDPNLLRSILGVYNFDYVMMSMNIADKHHASFIEEALPYVGNTKVIAMQVFMRGKNKYHTMPYFDSQMFYGGPIPQCSECKAQLKVTGASHINFLGGNSGTPMGYIEGWTCNKCGWHIDGQVVQAQALKVYQDCMNYVAHYNPEVILVGCNSPRQLEEDWAVFNSISAITKEEMERLENRTKPFMKELNFFKQPLSRAKLERLISSRNMANQLGGANG